MSFWRGLDSNETTALYTSEKISAKFACLSGEYNNDDLKKIVEPSKENAVKVNEDIDKIIKKIEDSDVSDDQFFDDFFFDE